jgi:hypothetical protein
MTVFCSKELVEYILAFAYSRSSSKKNLGCSSPQLQLYMHTVLPLPKVDLVSLMDSRSVPQTRFVFFALPGKEERGRCG